MIFSTAAMNGAFTNNGSAVDLHRKMRGSVSANSAN